MTNLEIYNSCTVRPQYVPDIDTVVDQATEFRFQYDKVEEVAKIPWWCVALIHNLEGGGSFNTYFGNGDPLWDKYGNPQKTIHYPAGRGPFKTWYGGAIEAISEAWQPDAWDLLGCLDFMEHFNGMGYRMYHPDVNSPYLWSYTTAYNRGKYTEVWEQGRFQVQWDATLVSQQVGAAAAIKRMQERNLIQIA